MELLEILSEIRYPATKVQIIVHADKRGVSHQSLSSLSFLPNTSFISLYEVKRVLSSTKHYEEA
jgi:hypothetical protein